jgi:hypothetical protein
MSRQRERLAPSALASFNEPCLFHTDRMSIKHNLFAASREIPVIRSATEPSLQPGSTSPADSRLSVRCAQVYLRVQWKKRGVRQDTTRDSNEATALPQHETIVLRPRQPERCAGPGCPAKESQVRELGKGIEETELHGNYVGQFSLTIVIYDRNLAAVEYAAAEFYKVFSVHDAQLYGERYSLLNAFLAAIPGNHALNLRHLYLLIRITPTCRFCSRCTRVKRAATRPRAC